MISPIIISKTYQVFPVSLVNLCLHYPWVNACDDDVNGVRVREPQHIRCAHDALEKGIETRINFISFFSHRFAFHPANRQKSLLMDQSKFKKISYHFTVHFGIQVIQSGCICRRRIPIDIETSQLLSNQAREHLINRLKLEWITSM